jgi:hypothetical protein
MEEAYTIDIFLCITLRWVYPPLRVTFFFELPSVKYAW